MATLSLTQRLGVCSWSLQPQTPQSLLDNLRAIGIPRVQLGLDPIREHPGVWGQTAELFAREQVTIVSGMFGTIGEDYSTLDSIRQTGGIVPDQHWDQNWKNIQQNATLTRGLGLRFVAFHAGFLPHDENDPALPKLRDRLARIADLFGGLGIEVGFETGQEDAVTLRTFLEKLNRPNVGVNFDPANMILYDKGDPTQALRTLGPWLKQCHIKDALRTTVPGTWGQEVA
ncbi:MAG: TIM barrel protein, partial [Verrucomicrobia bacterium]|nr:TIM barrel protein [Verrucomicrobiota bacterium]